MIEPLPYQKQDRSVGIWSIDMTPDGWENPIAEKIEHEHLHNEGLLEYIRVVKSFMKGVQDLDSFRKFFAKYGTNTGQKGMDPILRFTVDRPLCTYTFESTGPHMVVYAHTKE